MGRGKRSDGMQMQAQSKKKPKRKGDEEGGGQRIKALLQVLQSLPAEGFPPWSAGFEKAKHLRLSSSQLGPYLCG